MLWGTTGVSATFAPGVGATAIGAATMGVGGLLLTLMAAGALRTHWRGLRRHGRCVLLGGLAVAVYPLAFYTAMRLAGVTMGTVVSIGSAPLFSVLVEVSLEHVPIDRRRALGIVLGLAGITVLCFARDGGSASTVTFAHSILGIGLGLVAGLTYTIYSWAARRLMHQDVSPRAAMASVFGTGAVALIPVLLATGAPFLASWNNAAVGLYLALVPMFLGYLCFGYGLARVRLSTATTITLLEPAVAVILAALVVGERLSARGWLGIGLMFLCLLCIAVPAPAPGARHPGRGGGPRRDGPGPA